MVSRANTLNQTQGVQTEELGTPRSETQSQWLVSKSAVRCSDAFGAMNQAPQDHGNLAQGRKEHQIPSWARLKDVGHIIHLCPKADTLRRQFGVGQITIIGFCGILREISISHFLFAIHIFTFW